MLECRELVGFRFEQRELGGSRLRQKDIGCFGIGWDRGSSATRDQDGRNSASPGWDRIKSATQG